MQFRKKTLWIGISLLCGTAMAIGCKIMPSQTSTPPLDQLKIAANEISNWQPQGDITLYIGDQLTNFNDGGAPEYLSKGCIKTGVQVINGPNGRSAQAIIMDFGTDDKAVEMFRQKASTIASPLPDDKYNATNVSVQTTLDGVTGYAHFFNYYFEIGLTKFNNPQDAVKTLNQFLGLYEGKLAS
jgi:hypothetical protein